MHTVDLYLKLCLCLIFDRPTWKNWKQKMHWNSFWEHKRDMHFITMTINSEKQNFFGFCSNKIQVPFFKFRHSFQCFSVIFALSLSDTKRDRWNFILSKFTFIESLCVGFAQQQKYVEKCSTCKYHFQRWNSPIADKTDYLSIATGQRLVRCYF